MLIYDRIFAESSLGDLNPDQQRGNPSRHRIPKYMIMFQMHIFIGYKLFDDKLTRERT